MTDLTELEAAGLLPKEVTVALRKIREGFDPGYTLPALNALAAVAMEQAKERRDTLALANDLAGEVNEFREALAAANERAEKGHDVWTRDNHHDWSTCGHPTCCMVRDYEAAIENLRMRVDWCDTEAMVRWRDKAWEEQARADAWHQQRDAEHEAWSEAVELAERLQSERDEALIGIEQADQHMQVAHDRFSLSKVDDFAWNALRDSWHRRFVDRLARRTGGENDE